MYMCMCVYVEGKQRGVTDASAYPCLHAGASAGARTQGSTTMTSTLTTVRFPIRRWSTIGLTSVAKKSAIASTARQGSAGTLIASG